MTAPGTESAREAWTCSHGYTIEDNHSCAETVQRRWELVGAAQNVAADSRSPEQRYAEGHRCEGLTPADCNNPDCPVHSPAAPTEARGLGERVAAELRYVADAIEATCNHPGVICPGCDHSRKMLRARADHIEGFALLAEAAAPETEAPWFSCCQHCGDNQRGYGHAKPCVECQVVEPVPATQPVDAEGRS